MVLEVTRYVVRLGLQKSDWVVADSVPTTRM